ncbi:MAG: hypothetical protein QGG72_07045, partial [Verrucomicrobiota bacterium]|nr:hypothetical protein [Verrucomicrobiota bacterium]
MNDHENRDAEPPRECPKLLKALLYLNFAILIFLGGLVFSNSKWISLGKRAGEPFGALRWDLVLGLVYSVF